MSQRGSFHLKCIYFLALILYLKQTDVQGCKDTIDQDACEFMKKYDWCEEDISFLKEKCDKTCGWCSEDAECKDYGTYIDCKSLTQEECDANISKYYTRCRKSCNWCAQKPGAVWDSWSKWSRCSKACGHGAHSRERKCLTGNCEGKAFEVGSCILRACPSWSTWGEWTSCSVTCSGGERTRRRVCDQIGSCLGQASETEKCNTQDCEKLLIGFWGPCSKSCGEGTRTKVLQCSLNDINKCPRTYEECNAFKCPKKKCDNYRYKSESACCDYEERSKCGKDKTVAQRVLGGNQVGAEMFPWMARIEVVTGPFLKRTKCGGTLIHLQYVVTAAHCIEGRNKGELQVILGSTLTHDTSPLIQRIRVEEIFPHPNYSKPLNDVAIIKLKTPAIPNDRVDIICLPNGEEPPVDADCWIAGWGLTSAFANTASKTLMEGKVRHLPFGVCQNGYRRTGYGVFMDEKKMMCAGTVSGKVDTCRGDSGGPVMCQRCSSCSWYLAGVTSFGAYRCGTARRPGVYARMTTYEAWVKTIVSPSETSIFTCLS